MLRERYVKMCLKRWMHDAGLEMSVHIVYVNATTQNIPCASLMLLGKKLSRYLLLYTLQYTHLLYAFKPASPVLTKFDLVGR